MSSNPASRPSPDARTSDALVELDKVPPRRDRTNVRWPPPQVPPNRRRGSLFGAYGRELPSPGIDRADAVDDAADVVNSFPGRLNPPFSGRSFDGLGQPRCLEAHPCPPQLRKLAKQSLDLVVLLHKVIVGRLQRHPRHSIE
jgi:hypothetical protein